MLTETRRGVGKVDYQVVRTVLVSIDGFLCVGRRVRGDTKAGLWCLVGGVAEGSRLTREAIRETEEELGMRIKELSDDKPKFAFSKDIVNRGKIWRNNYYIMEFDDNAFPDILARFNREEFSEMALILEDDVRGMRFAFGNGTAVRDFFKFVGR
jgi:8-oxo-dGTP pyrophosphatase MutT (NUDIX family)